MLHLIIIKSQKCLHSNFHSLNYLIFFSYLTLYPNTFPLTTSLNTIIFTQTSLYILILTLSIPYICMPQLSFILLNTWKNLFSMEVSSWQIGSQFAQDSLRVFSEFTTAKLNLPLWKIYHLLFKFWYAQGIKRHTKKGTVAGGGWCRLPAGDGTSWHSRKT